MRPFVHHERVSEVTGTLLAPNEQGDGRFRCPSRQRDSCRSSTHPDATEAPRASSNDQAVSDRGEAPPSSCGIAVMAKASSPGRTKTRLVPPLSFEEAAAFNTAFLQDVAANILAAASAGEHRRLHGVRAARVRSPSSQPYSPPALVSSKSWLPNFGDCLFSAIAHLLARGHEAAVVLNSDSPTLPTSLLVETARILARPGRPRRHRSVDRRRLLSAGRSRPRIGACSRTSTGAPSASPARPWSGPARSACRFMSCRPGTTSMSVTLSTLLHGELCAGRPFAADLQSHRGAAHRRADAGARCATPIWPPASSSCRRAPSRGSAGDANDRGIGSDPGGAGRRLAGALRRRRGGALARRSSHRRPDRAPAGADLWRRGLARDHAAARRRGRAALAAFCWSGLAMRLIVLPSPPASTDIYRYIWDGRVQAAGINPYRYLPADEALQALRDEAIYPQINRAGYAPTIYPPIAAAGVLRRHAHFREPGLHEGRHGRVRGARGLGDPAIARRARPARARAFSSTRGIPCRCGNSPATATSTPWRSRSCCWLSLPPTGARRSSRASRSRRARWSNTFRSWPDPRIYKRWDWRLPAGFAAALARSLSALSRRRHQGLRLSRRLCGRGRLRAGRRHLSVAARRHRARRCRRTPSRSTFRSRPS